MNIQEIFDFPFVDRTDERKKLKSFFNQGKINTLWVNGNSGTGKSTFIKKHINVSNYKNKIYINFSPDLQNGSNCIQLLIEELERISDDIFSDFIKKNYKTIFDVAKQISSTVLTVVDVKLTWLSDLFFDSTKQFISKKNENDSLNVVINKYIDSILKKSQVCIVIDNFMYCDKSSLDVLLNIIKHYSDISNIKFILITTTEKLLENADIQKFLTEGITSEYIELKKFDKYEYFVQIIMQFFDLTDEEITNIKNIYNMCSGTPESLKTMLRNLFLQGAIVIEDDNSKAHFKENAIHDYLCNHVIQSNCDNEIDFNKFNTLDQILLQVILIFESDTQAELLINSTHFINNSLFNDSFEFNTMERLILLEQIHVIKNENERISIFHDLLFYTLKEKFKNSLIIKQLSHSLYIYMKNEEQNVKDVFKNNSYEYYIAKLVYLSKENNWQDYVFDYFSKVFHENKIIEASKGFKWLSSEIFNFEFPKQLEIAYCFYENGEYNDAYTIIISLYKSIEHNNFDYFFLKGKIENVLMKKEDSAETLKLALQYSKSIEQQILSMHMLQLVLTEIYGKKNEARIIFDNACKLIKDNSHYTLTSCSLLRNCMNYYKHNDDAKWYFEKAEEIAIKYNSPIDIAFVKNNSSFVDLKNGNFDKAYIGFCEAKNILENTKIHESSYPLVNMALCEIFKKNYEEAKEYLLEALVWNRSIYLDYVIKVNLSNCYYHLNERKSYQELSNILYNILTEGKILDGTILRKIAINLAIIYKTDGDLEKSRICFKIASNYIEGTSSEFRFEYHISCLNKTNFNKTCNYSIYYSITDFEPWGVTLSHD